MKYPVIILFLCATALGTIDKVDEISLPYWEQNILSNDPNEVEVYMRALVRELEVILDKVRDAVNHGIDLNNPSTRYFASPDADGDYANGTWRIIAVDEETFEIQKLIAGTWTEIMELTEDGFTYADITVEDLIADTVTTDTLTSGTSYFGTDPNYIRISENGTITMYGDARVERHMVIGAGSFKKGGTAPVDGYEGVFPTLLFNDAQDDEAHYGTWIPDRWDDTTDMTVYIHWQHDTVAKTGKVLWNLIYIGVTDEEDPAGAGTEITQLSAGDHPASEIIHTEFTTKILASNLSRHDDLGLKIWRNGDDGTDNLDEDAELISIHIHYTANQFGESLETFFLELEDGTLLEVENGHNLILEGV